MPQLFKFEIFRKTTRIKKCTVAEGFERRMPTTQPACVEDEFETIGGVVGIVEHEIFKLEKMIISMLFCVSFVLWSRPFLP